MTIKISNDFKISERIKGYVSVFEVDTDEKNIFVFSFIKYRESL
jgi:mRNA-degrading endonuclease RelE of RelBE toxin-antitoxin system